MMTACGVFGLPGLLELVAFPKLLKPSKVAGAVQSLECRTETFLSGFFVPTPSNRKELPTHRIHKNSTSTRKTRVSPTQGLGLGFRV